MPMMISQSPVAPAMKRLGSGVRVSMMAHGPVRAIGGRDWLGNRRATARHGVGTAVARRSTPARMPAIQACRRASVAAAQAVAI